VNAAIGDSVRGILDGEVCACKVLLEASKLDLDQLIGRIPVPINVVNQSKK
jgi:hypothetical protein